MAKKDDAVPEFGYSSTVRKTLVLGKDGETLASAANPLPVDAVVSVDTMTINAEMKEASGQDYYVTTTNLGDGTLTIGFDDASSFTVAGALALQDIVSIENKTQGWIYVSKGATVGDTSILLVAANQTTGYPVPGAADEFEIVYRGIDRIGSSNALLTTIDSDTDDIKTATEASAVDLAAIELLNADIKTATEATQTATELIDDAIATDDSAQSATPSVMNAGAEYKASRTEYADGDATILHSDIKGGLIIAGYDDTLEGVKNFPQSNAPKLATSPEAYTVLTATTVAYVEGSVIDTRAYSDILFHYSKTASDADNSYLKAVTLLSADGAVDYQQTSITAPSSGVSVIDDNVYERDKAALVEVISIPTNGANFMRFDLAKVTDAGTDSAWTIFITKVPR